MTNNSTRQTPYDAYGITAIKQYGLVIKVYKELLRQGKVKCTKQSGDSV